MDSVTWKEIEIPIIAAESKVRDDSKEIVVEMR